MALPLDAPLADGLLAREGVVRAAVFFGLFGGLLLAERWRLRRPRVGVTRRRRAANLALFGVDVALLRLVAPAGLVGVAAFCESRDLGLLRHWDGPSGLEAVIAIVLLDLAVWVQHVASHRIPLLWRFHAVHHADADLDVTSGVRFHPGEIVLSLAWKALVVAALGASPLATLLFEIVLNGSALATHANLALSVRLDAALRRVVVTPDMHRIHHSVLPDEANRNFGFALSLWDRLFSTYRAEPRGGQAGLQLGLGSSVEGPQASTVRGLLGMPFRGGAGAPAPPDSSHGGGERR